MCVCHLSVCIFAYAYMHVEKAEEDIVCPVLFSTYFFQADSLPDYGTCVCVCFDVVVLFSARLEASKPRPQILALTLHLES